MHLLALYFILEFSYVSYIISCQQSNSLRSLDEQFILSWNVFCFFVVFFDYAGVVFVIFVLTLQYHYEMQCFCYCIRAVQAKMLIYLNGQEYWWEMDEIKRWLCLRTCRKRCLLLILINLHHNKTTKQQRPLVFKHETSESKSAFTQVLHTLKDTCTLHEYFQFMLLHCKDNLLINAATIRVSAPVSTAVLLKAILVILLSSIRFLILATGPAVTVRYFHCT